MQEQLDIERFKAEEGQSWRVFYTRSRAEKKSHLRLLDAGIRSFLPLYVSYNTWTDRKKRVEYPLFRNYLFACVNESDRIRVLQTQGISHAVKFGAAIASISEKEMINMALTQADPERILAWAYSAPQIGDPVTIIDGPMRGLAGEVINHRGALYLVVRIDTIKQAIRVQIPADWVVLSSDKEVSYL